MTQAFIVTSIKPALFKAFFWDGAFDTYSTIRTALEADFGGSQDTQFLGSVSPLNTDTFSFLISTHLQMSSFEGAAPAIISIQVQVPKDFWLIYQFEPDSGRATNPRVITPESYDERYRKLQNMDDPVQAFTFLTTETEAIEARVRAECADLARNATLPSHFNWGSDAMEQFDFGKERAADAILGKP